VRTVTVRTVVEGPGIEAEQLWYDHSRWASWIAGFAALQQLGEDWPLAGARRVWVTRPDGRGLISETVRDYVAGDGQTLEFEDARVRGVQRVLFQSDGTRTAITVTLDLETKDRTPPARRWWLRRRFRGELERTLERFSYELAAERDR
jgi:hypothetical protein